MVTGGGPRQFAKTTVVYLDQAPVPALTGTMGLRTIVAAFEGGAAYMADGYARASGGLGVCFGIGGPGILNMTTALAAARAGRTWAGEVAVVANAGEALQRRAAIKDAAALEAGRTERQAFLARIRARGPNQYQPEDTRSDAIPMHPARVVAELRAAFPNDGVLCVDSGAHRAWFAEYWDVHGPATHFSLINLGPMGGAIPLGIGAKLARPERPLVVATGDGCMLMHGMEVHTAAREEVPLVIALMNSRSYGNIYFRASKMGPGPERLTDISGIDWVAFARSMGGDGERVDRPEHIAAAVDRALGATRAYLLDLHIDKTYPTPVKVWRERQQEWEDND
jgi:acetolactate synthase I/II/III large subunit